MAVTRTPVTPGRDGGAQKLGKTPTAATKEEKPKVGRQKVVRQKDPVGFMVKFLCVMFCLLGVARVLFGPFPLETRMWEKRAKFLEDRSLFRAEQKVRELKMKQSLPLIFAAGEGDFLEVQRLLEQGADIGQVTSAGETALHVSGIKGDPRVVDLLIKNGADVNARAKGGAYLKMTPLHWATYGRHLSAMRLLLDAGADVNAKNTKGETAVDVVEGFGPSGKLPMEMLLEYHGTPGRFLADPAPADDDVEDEKKTELSENDDGSNFQDTDIDRADGVSTNPPRPGKAPGAALAQVAAAANRELSFPEEGDVSDSQKAKRERAQNLMRAFQEQAMELERLHLEVKASAPDEL